jgi:uncharacterized membrane protein YphA (DoxX/SURF4 family)
MFPSGTPGVALLLLRVSVSIAVVWQTQLPGLGAIGTWLTVATIVLSLALVLGFLTPMTAALAMACNGLSWWLAHKLSVPVTSIVCLDTLALVLLGPGAYSLDAYRFGRRLIVVGPPR